ncbi:MAG: thioredoxin family protein [Beijerinckiaceae bacterium]
MITRRAFLASAAATGLVAARPSFAEDAVKVTKPVLSEDGMYHFDWYMESFLDFSEDIATAREKGRRLAVIWSQKGCIYCKRMALEHFTDPQIVGYVRKNFDVVHMNLFGDREVTDLDGKKMSEKAFARLYGIRPTPTIQFFPEKAEGLGAKPPHARESARMPGLLEPRPFLAMFRYVKEKGYEKQPFQQWLKQQKI